MVIGERLRDLPAQKNENGHTVPAVQTLEKMAKALEVPMYQRFFEGKPEVLKLPKAADKDWGGGKNAGESPSFAERYAK